ncbi:MAG: hypothetical protein ACRDPV_14130 [Gaiellaceae bacterium]
MKLTVETGSARLLCDLPETETPTHTLLDRSFAPGGPTIRSLTDGIGRGRPRKRGVVSARGDDEFMEIVRHSAGDDDAFEAALLERARREVVETLAALLRAADSGTPGSLRAAGHAELASLGRQLAAAAAPVAEHEAKGKHR